MAVQWSSATSLNRWCSHRPSPSPPPPPPPPFRATVPALRRAKRNGGIGCVSVPRELGAPAEVEAEQTALPDVEPDMEEEGVECERCSGTGWLLCDFCKGKKNNVKSENSPRIYRRCPTCKAAGYILCPRCRVYKCITFPESMES